MRSYLLVVHLFCGVLALGSAPRTSSEKIESLSRNVSLQIDSDIKRLIKNFFAGESGLVAPSDIKLTIRPEVVEATPPATEGAQAAAQPSVRIRAVKVAIDLVGDYTPEQVERLNLTLLKDYEKNGYRIKSTDSPTAPLFTAVIAVTPSRDIKLRKWLVGAAIIGGWMALMLTFAVLLRVTAFRTGKRRQDVAVAKQPGVGQSDTKLREPTFVYAGTGAIADIPIQGTHYEPSFDISGSFDQAGNSNKNLKSSKFAVPDAALERVFQASTFDKVVSEMMILNPGQRAQAMELLNLSPGVRDKLTKILESC